jgi:hypothetical protein
MSATAIEGTSIAREGKGNWSWRWAGVDAIILLPAYAFEKFRLHVALNLHMHILSVRDSLLHIRAEWVARSVSRPNKMSSRVLL